MADSTPSLTLKGPGTFEESNATWETWAFKLQTYARTVDFRLGLAFNKIEELGKDKLPDSACLEDCGFNRLYNCDSLPTFAQLSSDLDF